MSYVRSALTPLTLIAAGAAVVGLYAVVLSGLGSPLKGVVGQTAAVSMPVIADEDAASAQRLDAAFTRMGYRLDDVAGGAAEVPPVFLAEVPDDLGDLPDPQTRKTVFLRVMLPLVLVVNEEIAADRRRLLAIVARKSRGETMSADDTTFLAALAERYETEPGNLGTLLRRVDVVPPSLALAQAAAESGWGTSRLVRRENNLFGHIAATDDEAAPRMRAFATLHEAVRAYVLNLNTHRAYDQLRRARAQARARGTLADGHTLASTLTSYSERGRAYVAQIRSLIRANALLRYDHARLASGRGWRTARLVVIERAG
ncbi:MAG: glucosaminidase domain-containing protein [Actinomycetota bacterium]